ncbi:MAG: NUDIX hydrolase [Chloroflexia bacterium]
MSKPKATSEYSSGGVVYHRTSEGFDIAVVNRARHTDWSLPKGHIEEGETREQAALREVKEETGLETRIIAPLEEVTYFYTSPKKGLIRKTVYHYLLEASPGPLGGPNWEVSEVRWVPINEAHTLLSYPKDREVVEKAIDILNSKL